ncbi:MAG: 30S ribosomal protein S6 [Planctomycetes bacterium]|nr:30S ribosomal protein S6 [Planctomycetota bacterium]MBL7007637.1 30S ribosomal protein S6 [Planctomycetota bacterium]
MTQETHTYQAMFLLDNQEVRQNGFNAVRDQVKTTLEKHGLNAQVLRLWGERMLAYPVGSRSRATYLLGWLQGSGNSVNEAKKDFYLVGPVFRCMFLRQESVPEKELAYGIEQIEDSAVVIPDEAPEAVEEEPAVEAKPAKAAPKVTAEGEADADEGDADAEEEES